MSAGTRAEIRRGWWPGWTIEEKTCEIGYSWGACILSNLVARDVLRALGFTADGFARGAATA
jgi:hypothetical protein